MPTPRLSAVSARGSGGPHDAPQPRDRHLLGSAVAQPQQSAFGEDAYPAIHTKAAALLRSIACNHAFVDGNKRTALLATIGFYGINGYLFAADHTPVLHLVLDVATSVYEDVEMIGDHLKKWVVPIDELDLPDDSA
jgi:death-on-curing protein